MEFDEESLGELAASIKEHGVQQPLLVRRVVDDPDIDHELVDGERRLRAALRLCLRTVPIVVSNVGPGDDQFLRAVLVNCSRKDMTPSEHARAVLRVWSMPRHASLGNLERADAVAKVFGRGPHWVNTQLKLTELAPAVQALVDGNEVGKLSQQVAIELHPITDRARQTEVAQRIAQSGLRSASQNRMARSAVDVEQARRPSAGRRLHDDSKLVSDYATRIRETAELMLDLPPDRLALAFHERPGDRLKAIAQMGTAITVLSRVKSALERLSKEAW